MEDGKIYIKTKRKDLKLNGDYYAEMSLYLLSPVLGLWTIQELEISIGYSMFVLFAVFCICLGACFLYDHLKNKKNRS